LKSLYAEGNCLRFSPLVPVFDHKPCVQDFRHSINVPLRRSKGHDDRLIVRELCRGIDASLLQHGFWIENHCEIPVSTFVDRYNHYLVLEDVDLLCPLSHSLVRGPAGSVGAGLLVARSVANRKLLVEETSTIWSRSARPKKRLRNTKGKALRFKTVSVKLAISLQRTGV
jgi:hypothetical protein